MASTKAKQKIIKHHISSISRVIACASFLVLTIIGVSSLVRAMSLETIANENGIPASWDVASLGSPDTITIPATYWDQRQDDCDDANRQFEWVMCGYWTKGALQGVVKDHLGKDGLPIPAFTNSTDAWNANMDVFTQNVTGHEPVQTTDNFYRWFHETDKSKSFSGEVVFHRTGKNTYTYGREGVFPLDEKSNFSDNDAATEKYNHNFHFTSHVGIPMKISANGTEKFEFSGDDDVWVFLNGKLILDIGGLHEKLNGNFTINKDGTVSAYVQNVNDPSVRASLNEPSSDFDDYVDPLNKLIIKTYKDQYKTIDAELKEGDVVNLDFFYAERSTTESNTQITITNMNWPISADSDIKGEIVGQREDQDSNLVRYQSSIKNRDPSRPLDLERLAAYIREESKTADPIDGFLPLDIQTLYYTTTPDDEESWQPVDISAPSGDTTGFNLATPIRMNPAGEPGDTLYFRYFAETSDLSGQITSLVSFYTTLNGNAGVTYDYDTVRYGTPVDPTPTPGPHNVIVKYQYEDGSEASPTVTESHNSGDSFSIDSPKIDKYTPDIETITGTMGNQDQTFIVTYKTTTEKPPVTPVDPTPTNPDLTTPENPAEPIEPTKPITPYDVIVKYQYEGGSEASPTVTESHNPGDSFSIDSPEIANYTPDTTVVAGTMGEQDQTFIVVYKPLPEQPPIISIIPNSQTFGDASMAFLAPLGEFAFVPNTGIISDAVSAIFTQGFAEAILSQGFVMAMLLIFALSFATYFSLRKYLYMNLNRTPAKATRATNNVHTIKATHAAKSTKASSVSHTTMTNSTARTKATTSAKVTTRTAKAKSRK